MAIKAPLDRLLSQLERLAADGSLGPDAQATAIEYAGLPDNVTRSLRYVLDYYAASEEETAFARDYFVQIPVLAYREAKRQNPDAAMAFATAFISDYPGTSGTALLPKWTSLSDAVLQMKRAGKSPDRLAIWQASSRTVLCLNEFLNGLLGLLLVAWRCGLGKAPNPNVLGNTYGSKVHELSDLTDGEDGVFYLLLRLAKPDLRNSLAHGSAWLDYDAGVVRFTSGRQNDTHEELSLMEFLLHTKLAADLAQGYIAAMNTIVVFEMGTPDAISLLPQHLHGAWGS